MVTRKHAFPSTAAVLQTVLHVLVRSWSAKEGKTPPLDQALYNNDRFSLGPFGGYPRAQEQWGVTTPLTSICTGSDVQTLGVSQN